MARDVLLGREAGLLVGSHQWPLSAARMQNIRKGESRHSVVRHLNRLTVGTSWKQAPGTALVGRLVDATLHSLITAAVRAARVPAVGLPGRAPLIHGGESLSLLKVDLLELRTTDRGQRCQDGGGQQEDRTAS
ncbi:hypothetical protein [Streptomyces sp. NBC_00273]|uniref:hypothetical protein n=1 Tax=Streptomyces sp. NBC_00273 TaxID=2903644 RepID=UPI002E2AEF8F|nr:hypothetical protein [Streptomyces sp. NBC_00273]